MSKMPACDRVVIPVREGGEVLPRELDEEDESVLAKRQKGQRGAYPGNIDFSES